MRWKTSLRERAFAFALVILRLHPRIAAFGQPFIDIARQLSRAASAIGASLEEGDVAASRRDMGSKHAIALREAKESVYWLKLLIAADVLAADLAPLLNEAQEFVAMLTVSVKKLRGGPPSP